jgi:hypothetical protein
MGPHVKTVMPKMKYIHYFLYMDTFANYLSILWNEKWGAHSASHCTSQPGKNKLN